MGSGAGVALAQSQNPPEAPPQRVYSLNRNWLYQPKFTAGAGAVWVKSKEAAGTIRLEAHRQYLGKQTVEIQVRRAEREGV